MTERKVKSIKLRFYQETIEELQKRADAASISLEECAARLVVEGLNPPDRGREALKAVAAGLGAGAVAALMGRSTEHVAAGMLQCTTLVAEEAMARCALPLGHELRDPSSRHTSRLGAVRRTVAVPAPWLGLPPKRGG